jgi:phenylacetate-CoA ligase
MSENKRVILKDMLFDIPYSIGNYFVYIPYSWRLGRSYVLFQKEINKYNKLSEDEKISYILERLDNIVKYASNHFDFYHKLYNEYDCIDLKIKNLDDFNKIPIITKSMIRPHTNEFSGDMYQNTGGTSGEPFGFYIDKEAYAREWSHQHHIWSKIGYRYKDIKLAFRAKDLGKKNIVYNPVHNEFAVNIYKNVSIYKNEILKLFAKRDIRHIHGCPSMIYRFFRELEDSTTDKEKKFILQTKRYCIFTSEFPLDYIVAYLKEVWELSGISFYGHSEKAILAEDIELQNIYTPYMTYGYTEIQGEKLLGTSYHNRDMPLIRYDTGDIVEGKISENGLLENFKITKGREADFIVDKNGKKLSVASIVYGKHHKVFNIADYVQVKQERDGEIIFYITIKDKKMLKNTKLNTKEYFNLSNIKLDYKFRIIDAPILTSRCKLKIKI